MADPTFEDESGVTLAGEPGTVAPGTGRSDGGIEFLSSGAVLGRYVVIDRLGVGAMGVVYAAYDPELDRKVAVKILHDRRSGKGSQGAARLVREAQALARLSHPNVVAVHDVGAVDGRVFVAMEFVSGLTLGDWLKAEPRSRAEIISVLIEAGRGLSAAHAADLIHRDFKPENVMVRDDGHVLVMDFGVARSADASGEPVELDPTHDSFIRSQVDRTVDLTRTGALLGTPAYMAPEQHVGKGVDARSDQFAFCVTLYEALYGARPFKGDSLLVLAYQVAQGRVRPPPPGASVPARIRRVIMRGLSVDPTDRYASMQALLADLAKAARGRGRVVLAVGALAVVGAGLAIGPAPERRQAAMCTAEGERALRFWGEETREKVRAGLLASEVGDAEETMTRIEPWLEEYAQDLSRIARENCLDREVRSTRSAALIAATDDCLAERGDALAILTEEIAAGDRDMSIRAVQAAISLPPTSACEEDRHLLSRGVAPEAIREQVREARRSLERARTLASAGRYAEDEEAVREVVTLAEALDYPPLDAEVALSLGYALENQGQYEQAVASLERAFALALGEGQDEVAAKAASALVHSTGVKLAKTDDADRWESITRGLLRRIGGEDGVLAAQLDVSAGTVLFIKDDYEGAGAALDRALRIYEVVLGPEHTTVASCYNMLGIIALVRGEYDRALDYHRRALAIRGPVLGPRHPETAQSHANMGNVHYTKEDYAKAVESYELSLEVDEHVFGVEHPNVATGLNNIGNAYDLLGDREAALDAYRRALVIREHAFGPEHPEVAQTLHNIAIVERAVGDYDSAKAGLERALRIKAEAMGEDHISYARSLIEYGRLLMKMDEPEAARDQLERAVTIMGQSQIGPFELSDSRYTLARALAQVDPNSPRARELGNQALEGLPEGEHEQLRSEIEDWLADLGTP